MLYFEDFRIGDVRSVGDVEMREDEIIAFARQWDPQPWHVDPDAAARSPMRGITASSAHTFAVAAKLLNRLEPPTDGIASLRHEIELPAPVRPGDRLALTVTCIDKRPSGSKPDRGLVIFDMQLANQAGMVVLKVRSLMMVRTRVASDGG